MVWPNCRALQRTLTTGKYRVRKMLFENKKKMNKQKTLLDNRQPFMNRQPPKKPRFNYIVDIYTKWYKNCLYFRVKFACPGPSALSPFFEDSFTRIAYMANGRFNLAYMRHTGKWQEVFTDLSMDEAFTTIRDEPFFSSSKMSRLYPFRDCDFGSFDRVCPE